MGTNVLVWGIVVGAIAGILVFPRRWPEAVWACGAAVLLTATGLISLPRALHAVRSGLDVYLFLTGMMLLAELARREGLFDWLATLAVQAAGGSRIRLFALIYASGITVTVFLSNDATAVVLTPAVLAAVKRARVPALPYLLSCALIANAASFVLPISNPANLVVYQTSLPRLLDWLKLFLIPSVASIVATYVVLWWISRSDLKGSVEPDTQPAELSPVGRRTLYGILGTAAVLMAASAFGIELGWPTAVASIIAVLLARGPGLIEISKGVSWSVLPLVAGLFVLVEALDSVGALTFAADFLKTCANLPALAGMLAASFGTAAISNVINNLPSGLLASAALQIASAPAHIRDSVLIGIDLGPNLSVTGSLATLLWLAALRREGENVSGWRFLKAGALVMPPALFFATLAAWVAR